MNKIRETRKASIAIEKLHHILELLGYFYSNTTEWKNINQDAKYIESLLIDLSSDRKVDHARLASKLRNIFFKENKQLKAENKHLKEAIEELNHDREN